VLSDRFKLRLVTWSVIGLGFFHLFFGRYDYYPLIHWTMFSDKEHQPIKSKKVITVVVATSQSGQECVINLKQMVGSFKGSGGTAKAIEDDYIQALRKGDRDLADRIARQAERDGVIADVSALRVENRTWFIDGEKFRSGEVPLKGDKLKVDKVRTLSTIQTPNPKPQP